MKLMVTGTNIEITPALKSYVQRKLGKLDRHLPNVIEAKVEISEEKTKSPQQHYLVRATVAGGGGVFHGEERGEDLFRAIDKVAAVMTRQLEHHKGKLYDKGRGSSLARGEFNEEIEAAETTPKVVKTKRFIIKPMSVVEAVEQMEALGHAFFLYFDADAEELKLIYRRRDGNYAIIEPELG